MDREFEKILSLTRKYYKIDKKKETVSKYYKLGYKHEIIEYKDLKLNYIMDEVVILVEGYIYD